MIYQITKNNNSPDESLEIIGDEFKQMKIVKGINNRGIIISYIHNNYEENQKNYTTNIYIKCNKTIIDSGEDTLKLIKSTITEDMTYYYFYVESNTVCPICFKSEVTETKKGQCPNDEYELYTSEVKETAECVIKSLKTSSSSELIVNDNSNFLLFKNSALEEDQNLLNIYNIEENIPINYKEQGDDLVTTNTRYNYCEKKNDDDDSLGGGYIALIVILCLIVVAVAGIIVWKFVLKRNSDAEITKPNVTEMNLKDVYTE